MSRDTLLTALQVFLAVLFVTCAAAGGFALSVAAGLWATAMAALVLLVLVVMA